MLRMLGAALVLTVPTVFGVKLGAEAVRRARFVQAMSSSLVMLRSEIVTNLCPLPEAIRRLQLRGPKEVQMFYGLLEFKVEDIGEREFSAIWDECVACTEMSKSDKAALSDAGRVLGRYAAEEQAAALTLCIEQLNAAAKKSEVEAQQTRKLCTGLGLGAGMVLAIMLL